MDFHHPSMVDARDAADVVDVVGDHADGEKGTCFSVGYFTQYLCGKEIL